LDGCAIHQPLADPPGIAVGLYDAVSVRDGDIQNSGLLGDRFQEILHLIAPPHHPHHAGSGPGLKGFDQGRALFAEDFGHIVAFAMNISDGQDQDDDQKNDGRTDDHPGGDMGLERISSSGRYGGSAGEGFFHGVLPKPFGL
jgi:hypothetical protein